MDLYALRLFGKSAQGELLVFRHCLSSKVAHVARWGPAEQFVGQKTSVLSTLSRGRRGCSSNSSKLRNAFGSPLLRGSSS